MFSVWTVLHHQWKHAQVSADRDPGVWKALQDRGLGLFPWKSFEANYRPLHGLIYKYGVTQTHTHSTTAGMIMLWKGAKTEKGFLVLLT